MKLASLSDIDEVASHLYLMYNELKQDNCSSDMKDYIDLARFYIVDKLYDVWIEYDKGIFIVKDESINVIKEQMWNGVAVYIKPDYRHTSLLNDFYTKLFNTYKGTIMGYTESNSEHNKVLAKRHILLGYVYKLNIGDVK